MRTYCLRAFLILMLLLLAACRRDRAVPTPLPTAAVPETVQATPVATPAATGPVTAVAPEDIDWPPQVVYSSPAPGEEIRLGGAITIRFDQPMDQQSVEAAFAVNPVDERTTQVSAITGVFTWPRPDTVIFTPQSQLRRQQNYRVRIATTAVGQNGQTMEAPVDLPVQTVGYLDVSQVIPTAGTRDVQTDSAITVLFNRPVVPLTSTGQQANLPQPLRFDPPLSGRGEWVSTSIYRFVADEPLAGATSYQVEIGAGLQDVTGGVLERDYTWSFTTLRPSVVSVEPANGSTNIAPTAPITITFNMPMDRAATEAAIAVRGVDAPAVTLAYDWSEDGRSVSLTPSQALQLDTEYQVVVGQPARSANGEATLNRETVSGFRIVPLPAVTGTTPGRGVLADRWQYGFSIQFATLMDLSSLEERLTIEPAPDPNRVDYYFNEFNNELYVQFDLQRNAEYTVTVPGDAADVYGNSLGESYTWRFSTPGYDPLASVNLPQTFSQLSTSFPTRVDIINRNVTRVDVALYNLGLPLNLLAQPHELHNYRPAAEPERTWSLAPDTPREQVGVQQLALADGGTLPTGIYFLHLDAPEVDENHRFWQNQRHLLIVADTNIVVKEMFNAVHVWVTDLATGQPVSGRNLALYNRRGVQNGTAVSDANGFASFAYTPAENYLEGVIVVSNQPGQSGFGAGSSYWDGGVTPWRFGFAVGYNDEPALFTYLYTDRPIYRPGDTVYYKGIVRQADYGRYSLPQPQTLEMGLSPAFYVEEGGLFESITVNVDEDGAFSGEYSLPDDVALGSYQFYLRGDNVEAYRNFSVADYRAPEFLIALTPAEPEALRGQSVEVTLEATYFFGGPVTDVPVEWHIYEETFSPTVPGPFYYFGDGGNFYYESASPFILGGGGFLGNQLLSGSGRTDGSGRLTITVPADLLAEVDPGSRTITVEASVSDLANFPVTSRASITLHDAEVYVGIVPSDYLATAGREASVDLLTVAWDGRAVANQNVEVVFYEREWRRSRQVRFNLYYTEWEAIDTEVERVQVTTDAQGKAVASFTPEAGGSYVAVATVTDRGGRSHTSSASLWAIDSSFAGWRSDPKERKMDVTPDQQAYQPGDVAQILVQSPFAGPVQAWLTIERGNLLEQRVITLGSASEVVEIPITADFAPNVYVSVVAIKGANSNDANNPYADIRLGIAELVVAPDELALNLTLTPRADLFAPGETATYDITVTDHEGQPVQAELSLALVDLAVLTLKEDNAPPILEAFYARQPYRSQVGSGLFVSGEGLEVEVPLEGGGLGGGGGDGFAELAQARALDEEDDVRRDFPDTAYWQAKLTTDADGRATIEIPLPDSLTTWRLSSKAVTADSLVGQTSVDVRVTLPLLLRPVTPRFFTVGDVLQIGAIVNNNTNQAVEAAASLQASGLTLNGNAEQTVTVPANGRQLVRWQVSVNDTTFADLTFRVSGGGFSDATKPTFGVGPDNLIPVYRYTGEDIVGTSGVLTEAGRRVEAILLPDGVDLRQGSVDVTLSPSLAAALIDSLKVINEEDYLPNCAHGVADRLLPNVATAGALRRLNVDEPLLISGLEERIRQGVQRLQALARQDGGWAWCYSEESSDWLTAYALLGLAKAQQAGYESDPAVLERAGAYLRRNLGNPARLTEPFEVNRQAFFLYVLAERGVDVNDEADALFSQRRALLDPYARALLALVYELSGDRGANQRALLADLNDSVVLSATGAHWEDESVDFRNLNSNVRGTAVAIAALARIQPDDGTLPQAVRWLMTARKALRWSTSHETAWSIFALTEWMAATGELEAAYDYSLAVNTRTTAEGSFSQANVTESESLSTPLRDLTPQAVNFLEFQRGGGNGRLYYTVHLDSFIDAHSVSAVSRGITVQRTYYDAACDPESSDCQPIDRIQAGQQVRVELTIIAANDLLYALVEDPIPAGAEAIDPNLETTASGLGGSTRRTGDDYRYGYWGWWSFNRIEYRDEKVVFLAEFLPAGTYQYTYYLQTNIPGQYQVMPATARQEFFPEVFGRSDGMLFTIFE